MTTLADVRVNTVGETAEPKGERERYRKLAIPFTEDFKYSRGLIVFEAASFNAWTDAFVKQLGFDAPKMNWNGKGQPPKKIGNYRLYMRRLPFGSMQLRTLYIFSLGKPQWGKETLPMARAYDRLGDATFDGDVHILVLDDPATVREDGPWMSLTPQEIYSQRAGVRKARGNVLITGLGLGWLARRVLEKKTVSYVEIIEHNRDVARVFGEPLIRDFGLRVKITVDDAWERLGFDPKKKRREQVRLWNPAKVKKYDSILLDTFKGLREATFDDRVEELVNHGKTWAWGFTRREVR